MGRRDVAVALEAMQDDEVRAALEAGEFDVLPEEVELDPAEQEMVSAAAGDYPETTGFGQFGQIGGAGLGGLDARVNRPTFGGGANSPLQVAVDYASRQQSSPINLR